VVNSDELNAYVNYKTDELPVELQNKEVGYISDVKFQNGNFIVNKLSEIVEENKYSARAKHILFKFDVTPKLEVRQEAQRVLNLLKNGSNFEETARTYSQDGSASNGGDLGWFTEGTMVLPFQNAVFSRSKTGLIPRIIESEFGYHLIYVSNTKTNLSYNVSTIVKVLVPSDYTKNFVYRESELFRSQVDNKESFIKNVKESNYKMLSSNNLNKNDKTIADLNNSRSIIIWVYSDNASLNSISDVIEMDDGYVIAIVSDIKEKGTKNLDDVKNSITKKILNNKKFEYVSNKLSDYKSLFDLTQLNNKGKIYNMNTLDFTTNSLSNVGYSPEAIGIAFSMEEGELTKPFMNDEGIVVMGLNSFIIADSIENYSEYSSSLRQANQLSTPFRIDNVIKEFSSIEDYRYKFF
jgi:peptidyl-prolyl cis-trans isomerase D